MPQPKLSSERTTSNLNRLRRVLHATKLLHSTIDLPKLTGLILGIVREEVRVDRGTVFVVDWDRREVRSLVAQDVNGTEIRLSFGDGIAGVVAATGETLDIPDAYADQRFNPRIDSVLGYRTKDVFCMPVMNREGRTVGLLELLNRTAPLGDEELEFLRDISVHIGLALENAWLHRQLLEKRKMDQELALAADIQKNLIPAIPQNCGGVQVAASTTMCTAVGGDYLEYYPLGSGRFILMLGDVSGKGIGAALVMTSMHSTCRALLRHAQPLERIALVLNESLIETTRTQTYVTLLAILVDATDGKLHCLRAGHHPPLLVDKNGTTRWLDHGGGLPIGLFGDLKVSTETYDIEPGTSVVLYTDGVTEAQNPAGEHFGLQRLDSTAIQLHTDSARNIHDGIRNALYQFMGESNPTDDTTLVVLKF
jgi:sigma-B regulation protein RsbU (phosphoserine phosphatase)